jgi:hypothetical protein
MNKLNAKTKILLLIAQVERENENMRIAIRKLEAMKKN